MLPSLSFVRYIPCHCHLSSITYMKEGLPQSLF